MINYQLSLWEEDLQQVLSLQKQNLETIISADELRSQGFVTVNHELALLKQICGTYGHMLGKEDGKVVAYALVMLKEFGHSIPVLVPMFEKINTLSYRGVPLKNSLYLVMGQVCVAKPYRGTGIFQGLYAGMRKELTKDFDYLITEVASRNQRSLKAHAKVGFVCIDVFHAADEEWQILLWDWRK